MASKFLKLYDSILKLVSNELNFKTLRTKIHTADPPLIPFPGIYQSDLVSTNYMKKIYIYIYIYI